MPKKRKVISFSELSVLTGIKIQTLRNKSSNGEFNIWDAKSVIKFCAKTFLMQYIDTL